MSVPIWVLLRPRPGEFVYSHAMRSTRSFAMPRLFLASRRGWARLRCARCEAAASRRSLAVDSRQWRRGRVVFHRAFDLLPDPQSPGNAHRSSVSAHPDERRRETRPMPGARAIADLDRASRGGSRSCPAAAFDRDNVAELAPCHRLPIRFMPPRDGPWLILACRAISGLASAMGADVAGTRWRPSTRSSSPLAQRTGSPSFH